MLEKKNELPYAVIDPKPMKEIIKNKKKTDYYTSFLRKKFMMNTSYKR